MNEALYLFGLCRCARSHILEAEGLDETAGPPRIEVFGEIGAVICRVDAGQFTGPESEARLADPAWLLPRLHRHNAVLEGVQRQLPLLPLRFGTLFKTIAGLEHLIMLHRADISRFFKKVEGREEWALKLFYDRELAAKELGREMLETQTERLRGLAPGKRYLEERQLRTETERLLPERLREECANVVAILQACCSDLRERSPLHLDDKDGKGRMLRNWALLLPQSSVAALIPRLEQYREARCAYGIHLEWTGPWPPYSFCPPLDAECSGSSVSV